MMQTHGLREIISRIRRKSIIVLREIWLKKRTVMRKRWCNDSGYRAGASGGICLIIMSGSSSSTKDQTTKSWVCLQLFSMCVEVVLDGVDEIMFGRSFISTG